MGGISAGIFIEGTAYNSLSINNNTNDAFSSLLAFGKSRGTANGAVTSVGNGDRLGGFYGADGSTNVEAARITAEVDGTPGANDMPGRLVFSTTADGASSPTERMRIDNLGVVCVGATGGTNVSIAPGADVPRFEFNNSGTGTMTFGYRGPSAPSLTNRGELRVQANSPLVFSTNNIERMTIAAGGSVSIVGALSKGSGSFRIEHPLPEKSDTHQLVHSFIEGPQADLIYRGHASLQNGYATVNIDQAARITEGTFEALCRNVCCFTTNESDWTPVRGAVSGNMLTIEAQDPTSTAEICWMVIGERKDKHMLETDWTDEDGRVITEPLKGPAPAEAP
jgi:hypothetical protein